MVFDGAADGGRGPDSSDAGGGEDCGEFVVPIIAGRVPAVQAGAGEGEIWSTGKSETIKGPDKTADLLHRR